MSGRPQRPNKEQYQQSMDDYSKKINDLITKIKAIKVPAKDTNNPLLAKKNEARAVFDSLLKQKQELSSKKATALNQLKAVQQSLKKGTEKAKSNQGFKNADDVEVQISALEKELQKGVPTLMEEKRLVAEISNLKKQKKLLIEAASKPSTIETDKLKLDTLRAELDVLSKGIKELDPQVDAAKEALNAADAKVKAAFAAVNEKWEEKKAIQAELDTLKAAKNEVFTTFKAEQDAWYQYDRELRQKKLEEEREQRAAEKEAKLVALAEKELEEAEISAFSGEIALCNALIKHFGGSVNSTSSSAAVNTNVRKVDADIPARATVLSRKEDREEDFLCLGNKKNKSKKRPSTAPNAKPLKMDIELMDQLTGLKIAIPKTTADVPATLEALEEKKKYFDENSATQTAANKKAALLKVQKLREGAAAEDELAQEE
ncbi:hypothetical protein BC833DRAFT_581764 [Globomyces pollinis-pini]|nr:hypothetical protein BC833DRAFT_581764 [Globomyces pollinis-pini]